MISTSLGLKNNYELGLLNCLSVLHRRQTVDQSKSEHQFENHSDFFNQEKRVDKQVSRMNYVENNNLDRLEKRLKSRRQEDYSDDYFESEEAMMSIKVS